MSFHQKIMGFIIIIFLGAFAGGFYYYRKIHPKYIPPAPREEVDLTIIPGWNLRKVADYFVSQGFAANADGVYQLTGVPARDYRADAARITALDGGEIVKEKPAHVSYEGYLAPETIRVYKDSPLKDVLEKFVSQRDKEIGGLRSEMEKSGRSVHQIITMASILEKEAQSPGDQAKIADILWRRYEKRWALQVDSSVHYAIDKEGTVFTTKQERDNNSPWNTYKYPGLPLGPISNPGLASIGAALHPEKNNFWYYLSDKEGVIHYAGTLEEQNANRRKYLK